MKKKVPWRLSCVLIKYKTAKSEVRGPAPACCLMRTRNDQEHLFYSSIIHVFDEGVNKGKGTHYECLELNAKVTTHKHTKMRSFLDVSNFSPPSLVLFG